MAGPGVLYDEGDHASRPANGSGCVLYACTTHALVYRDDGTTWTTWAALGGGAVAAEDVSVTDTAGNFTGTDVEAVLAELQDNIDGVSGGVSYDQVYPYPSSFSGDSDDMTATTNWTDVDAFTVKEIQNSSILHLQTVGPSKDDRVRFTLGTTKAGAFDFRFTGVMAAMHHWSTSDDTYAEIALATSGGTVIAIARLQARTGGGIGLTHFQRLVVGTTAVVTTNTDVRLDAGMPFTLRITRDGGNLLGFDYGLGTAPVALRPMLKVADNLPYAPSSSGTVARVELSIHTPAGPGATQHQVDLWIDAFESL